MQTFARVHHIKCRKCEIKSGVRPQTCLNCCTTSALAILGVSVEACPGIVKAMPCRYKRKHLALKVSGIDNITHRQPSNECVFSVHKITIARTQKIGKPFDIDAFVYLNAHISTYSETRNI
jgi:hypothetical protein